MGRGSSLRGTDGLSDLGRLGRASSAVSIPPHPVLDYAAARAGAPPIRGRIVSMVAPAWFITKQRW